MALSIRERSGEEPVEWIDIWPFPTLPTFISSHAFDLLKREFARYVRDEVPGRAFLVSGHRGAGKTTLVARAVDELNREILRRAVDEAKRPALAGRVAARQRPLLVRLHGPSLLGGPLAADGRADDVPDMVTGALEQIMVGLYRALASEIGRGVTQLANAKVASQAWHPRRNDLAEVAAQFILDLDNAPKPALLRESYDRLGCLRTGVLWPVEVGLAMVRAGSLDQGMRELVALSTAAQAFEVCAGEVKSSVSTTQSDSNTQTIEWKIDLALADIINKAIGLAAGVAIGFGAVAIGNGSPGAIAAGAAVGLVTAATYSRSKKRAITGERKSDYSFIRDRTKRSLDRDLPGVIQRIREAGLAPIFIVDELDKIEDPDTSIARFVNKVKHLTTDFGAFCFLTDRAYFETVMGKVVAQPFPPEHTYFSHWLFVLHDTSEILAFLDTVIVGDAGKQAQAAHTGTGAGAAPAAEAGAPADQPSVAASTLDDLPRTILALYLLHRSKLNTVDLFREIGRCCDDQGRVRAASGTMGSSFGFRIAATIQLGVHVVLQQAALRERSEADPRFAQAAVDALYILSRAWESGAADVLLTRDAIAEQVSARMRQRIVPMPGGSEDGRDTTGTGGAASGREALGERNLDFVEEHVLLLVGLLADLKELTGSPEAQLGPGLPAPPDQVVPLELTSRLIEEVGAGSRRYRFLYDVQGREIRVRDALAAEARSDGRAGPSRESVAGIADAEQVRSLLDSLDVGLEDFIVAGILPPALDPIAFDAALVRLRAFRDGSKPYDELVGDLQLLDILRTFFRTHWAAFRSAMHLAIEVAVVAACPLGTAVRAIGRSLDLPAIFVLRRGHDADVPDDAASPWLGVADRPRVDWLSGADPEATAPPPAPSRDFEALQGELKQYRTLATTQIGPKSEKAFLDRHVRTCWTLWMDRLRVHAIENRPVVDVPHFSDIVCAAAGRAPGTLFEMDLRRMTVAAWSAICLQGFPERSRDLAPGWSFVAGLWGLGFDKGLLEAAANIVKLDDEGCAGFLEALVASAPSARVQGVILIMSEDRLSLGLTLERRPEDYGHPSNRKILALREHELALYSRALAWLEARGALSGLSYEQ